MISQAGTVVIGSGAFGASAAYHLAALGARDVVLLDRFELASQTSPRAAGLTSQVRATDNLTRLSRRSVRKLERFSEETGQPLRFAQTGALKIARTERHVEQLQREVARGREVGVPIELISKEEARRLLPILDTDGVLGVTYSPTDCNLEPSQLAIGYVRAAQALGVTTLAHTPVIGIETGPSGVTAVITPAGRIATECVVDAAGAWSRAVAALAGAAVPLVPTRHQLFITAPIDGLRPSFPIVRVIDANVYVRYERGGLMLGGYEANPRQLNAHAFGPQFQIADLELDVSVLWGLAGAVRQQLPIFQESSVQIAEHRGGLPTITPDDRYLAGPVPGVRGLWIVSGCCVGGLSVSPALGEAVAQWIVGGAPEIDISEVAPGRFAGQTWTEASLRAQTRDVYAQHYSVSGAGHAQPLSHASGASA